MVIPLFVGREKSINALDTAMQEDKQILLVAQTNAEIDDPTVDDIHEIGTLSTILQLLKLPDGTVKVLVEGVERANISRFEDTDAFLPPMLICLRLPMKLTVRKRKLRFLPIPCSPCLTSMSN